jgi:hypothetical protein
MRAEITIGIEHDENKRGCYKIVIRWVSAPYGRSRSVIGIPLRGVTLKVAKEMLQPMRFAFRYGVDATSTVLRHLEMDVDTIDVVRSDVEKSW